MKLVLWYRHVEPGAPLTRVAGLTLVARAALDAQRAGYGRVVVAVTSADRQAVEANLDDPRLTLPIEVTDGDVGDTDGAIFALADRVWLRSRLADAKREPVPAAGLFHGRPDELTADDSGDGWCRIHDRRSRRAGETMLLRSLVKAADGVVSRTINRRISTAITRRLAPLAVKPNHITTLVLLIGLASGPLAAMGSYLGFAIGGLLYYVSAVLDGVDGELSRLKHLGSPFGAWYDTITDDLCSLSWTVGVYVGLYRHHDWSYWPYIGAGAVALFVLTIASRYYLLIARIGEGDHQKLASANVGDGGFAKIWEFFRDTFFRTDFIPFFAMVTAVADATPIFAVAFAAGTIFSAFDSAVTVARTPAKSAAASQQIERQG